MSHYKEMCKYGFIHRQCRCIDKHSVRVVACENPLHAAVKRDYHEWQTIYKVGVLDPDGWRRNDGVDFSTPITLEDFQERLLECTVNSLAKGDIPW